MTFILNKRCISINNAVITAISNILQDNKFVNLVSMSVFFLTLQHMLVQEENRHFSSPEMWRCKLTSNMLAGSELGVKFLTWLTWFKTWWTWLKMGLIFTPSICLQQQIFFHFVFHWNIDCRLDVHCFMNVQRPVYHPQLSHTNVELDSLHLLTTNVRHPLVLPTDTLCLPRQTLGP